MSREYIDHGHIVKFADRTVNLHRDDAKEYREQVNRLREKLEQYVVGNPDFELRKILLSGSLAKHTALKTLNDVDVAVYVKSAPEDVGQLTRWLADKLRKAFPNLHPEQVVVQTYSVRIDFRGTGLSVDIVPIYAEEGREDEDWGYLVSQEDGKPLRTNITLHRDFIRKRRKSNQHYAQVVRLLKWWVRTRKQENAQFGFKSFMVELVLAKLVDDGADLNDYPEALLKFFDYIAESNFSDTLVFCDYPEAGVPMDSDDPIQVFDPVNANNNVGRKYTENQRSTIVDECIDAGDAIEAALRAETESKTLNYWRKVFGASFSD